MQFKDCVLAIAQCSAGRIGGTGDGHHAVENHFLPYLLRVFTHRFDEPSVGCANRGESMRFSALLRGSSLPVVLQYPDRRLRGPCILSAPHR
jgi:hypothetical protein